MPLVFGGLAPESLMHRAADEPGATRPDRGFALFEVLLAATILTIAMMAQAAGVSSGRVLAASVEERGLAVATLARFVERLRADPGWGSLYARLAPLSVESAEDTSLAWLKADRGLATQPASAYYSDFTVPKALGQVTVLVQVPRAAVGAAFALREDQVAPRYGLPADLNGDGVVDGAARDDDYRALPIVVRLRWRRPGQDSSEIVLATWLRGER